MKKIAIPITEGKLSVHFGHCREFYICDVSEDNEISNETLQMAPSHEPGLLPRWLSEQGVTDVIAGGMGQRAISLFHDQNINVAVGAPPSQPRIIVEEFLAGTLELTINRCNH